MFTCNCINVRSGWKLYLHWLDHSHSMLQPWIDKYPVLVLGSGGTSRLRLRQTVSVHRVPSVYQPSWPVASGDIADIANILCTPQSHSTF